MSARMKAAVFVEPGRIELADKPIPDVGPNDALVRITTTTICGTDVHILKGEYPVAKGLTIGHEPVGVIEKLGSAVQGYTRGPARDRRRHLPELQLLCRAGRRAVAGRQLPGRRGRAAATATRPPAGWRFGNLIDGTPGRVRAGARRQANLAPIPDGLTDEQVLMCPDIMSTGFKGAENANIRIGDTVVVFAQGPIGLCATAGARLLGATTIIAVDGNDHRLGIAKKMGADVTLNFNNVRRGRRDHEAHRRPRRRMSSIEALGTQAHLRVGAARAQAGRHAVEPGRVFRGPDHPAVAVRGRPGRPHDQHRPLPRRQGAHAPPDERGGVQPRSTWACWSRTTTSSTTSSRPTTCSRTSATAC